MRLRHDRTGADVVGMSSTTAGRDRIQAIRDDERDRVLEALITAGVIPQRPRKPRSEAPPEYGVDWLEGYEGARLKDVAAWRPVAVALGLDEEDL